MGTPRNNELSPRSPLTKFAVALVAFALLAVVSAVPASAAPVPTQSAADDVSLTGGLIVLGAPASPSVQTNPSL